MNILQTFEKSEEQTVTLSEISDSSGSIKVTPLTRPYKQEQLKPQVDQMRGSSSQNVQNPGTLKMFVYFHHLFRIMRLKLHELGNDNVLERLPSI